MLKVEKNPICERLRLISVGRGIGVTELSRRTGMSEGHLYNIFHGRTICPLFSTVVRIVTALDADDIPIVEQVQKKPRLRLVRNRSTAA